MTGALKELTRNLDGSYNVTVTVRDDCREIYAKLKDEQIDLDIRKHRNKRSLDANAFCWALCSDIGKVMRLPKEEVYQNSIRGLGKHQMLIIKREALESFKYQWGKNGVGWFVEEIGDCKSHPGYVWIFAYSGTSTYNTQEMSVLLDGLVSDAEALNIKIPLGKDEYERMKRDWRCA